VVPAGRPWTELAGASAVAKRAMADKCVNDSLCVLCKDKGMDCAHRLGSRLCKGVDPPSVHGRR